MCLILLVPWVGLQYLILVFPGYTHFFHSLPLESEKYNTSMIRNMYATASTMQLCVII